MNENTPAPQSVKARILRNVPRTALLLYALALVAAVAHILSCLSPAVADALNGTVAAALRFVLAKISGVLPISIGECLLLASPVLLVLLVVLGVRYASDSLRFRRYLFLLLGVLLSFYVLFVFTLGCAYRGETLDQKLALDRREVGAGELYDTAVLLREEANALTPYITQRYRGASSMPYTLEEMNEKLLRAYDTVCEAHPFIQHMDSRVKPVSMSEAMSYAHITGVYFYVTGEANLNVDFPDYTLPFTAAHELAHQRGIAREDEANFVAFLVCVASEDPYIRYSGYINMLEYVAAALASADGEAYATLCAGYTEVVAYEMIAYSRFYEKYADSKLGEISGSINNAYLESQGTAGTRSYGMVVDLAVAYYR